MVCSEQIHSTHNHHSGGPYGVLRGCRRCGVSGSGGPGSRLGVAPLVVVTVQWRSVMFMAQLTGSRLARSALGPAWAGSAAGWLVQLWSATVIGFVLGSRVGVSCEVAE